MRRATLSFSSDLLCLTFFYDFVVLPIFSSPIEDEIGNINFYLSLLNFNNMFVPCVVTFLSSSSCMQGLLVESDEIISQYSHEVCDFWFYTDISQSDTRTRGQYSMHDVNVVPLVPPYIYHYQCGSVFLTLYIPVYIYMYSFQLLVPFIYMMLLSLLEYEHIPAPIRPMLHAIIWPKYLIKQHRLRNVAHSPKERDGEKANYDRFLEALVVTPSILFDSKTVITFDILHNMSVLLTFGLCSPFLTIIIAMAMILKINMWLVLLGRFCNVFSSDGSSRISSVDNTENELSVRVSQHKQQVPVTRDNIHPALIALSRVCIPIENVFKKSVWPITWTSAAFFAFLCWDISADKVGWWRAIWIPCLVLSFPVFMWLITKIAGNWGNRVVSFFVRKERKEVTELAVLSHHVDG